LRHPAIPKGRAMAVHLMEEFNEGKNCPPRSENPYDFFDQYEQHYAWHIGHFRQHL